MKIAVVTCYDQNDYVRARTLRTAFQATEGAEITIVRNEHKGLFRYVEVPLKLVKLRFTLRPDAYVVTFRGYEILLFMVLSFVRKPIIFDEMINFTEWMMEHGVLHEDRISQKLFRRWYGWLAGRSKNILADTEAHAEYSAMLNRLPIERYRVIPIGTDESVFQPSDVKPKSRFTVFYYGHMLPLHGLSYLLDAAILLKDEPNIYFQFVGGKPPVASACQSAVDQGANVTHQDWIEFDELPLVAQSAGLCVGGPFGDTLQSQYVITGKTYQFLAMGCPVLIGQNKVNQLFEDKKNCLLVPQANAEALAETIRWAYRHQSELKTIGHNGHKLYEANFSQKLINQKISSIVAELQTI